MPKRRRELFDKLFVLGAVGEKDLEWFHDPSVAYGPILQQEQWGQETEILLSQNVIPSRRSLGGFQPYTFTKHGVAMLSSVLNSQRAVQMNILIIRAFVKLREMLATHKDLARKLEEMEKGMIASLR